jgi:aldose 1-epimerase
MLLTRVLPSFALFLSATWAQPSYTPTNTTGVEGNGSGPDSNGKYTISAEGIRMQFIPYGASISNLFINDTHGVERDIVLGFDNATAYSVDTLHPYLGPVPGKASSKLQLYVHE